MNKNELIKTIAANIGKTQNETENIVRDLFDTLRYLVECGESVSIPGFGKFEAVSIADRVGYNPATKEKILIPSYMKPKFTPSKEFKHNVKMNLKHKF